MGLRLAYMTGQYPRVTDTFIQREVLALRALGHYVKTFSVRHPPDNESAGEDAAECEKNDDLSFAAAKLSRCPCRSIFPISPELLLGV